MPWVRVRDHEAGGRVSEDLAVGVLVVMALLAGFLHGAHWSDRRWVRFVRQWCVEHKARMDGEA